MKTFNLQSLEDWFPLGQDTLSFLADDKPRTIRVQFNVSEAVQVWLSYSADADEPFLVAASDGLFEVSLTTRSDVWLNVKPAAPNGNLVVFARTFGRDHIVEKMSDEKFTSIERRQSVNPEIQRMMMLMKLNEERRADAVAAELREVRRLRADLDARRAAAKAAEAAAVVIETEATPDVE